MRCVFDVCLTRHIVRARVLLQLRPAMTPRPFHDTPHSPASMSSGHSERGEDTGEVHEIHRQLLVFVTSFDLDTTLLLQQLRWIQFAALLLKEGLKLVSTLLALEGLPWSAARLVFHQLKHALVSGGFSGSGSASVDVELRRRCIAAGDQLYSVLLHGLQQGSWPLRSALPLLQHLRVPSDAPDACVNLRFDMLRNLVQYLRRVAASGQDGDSSSQDAQTAAITREVEELAKGSGLGLTSAGTIGMPRHTVPGRRSSKRMDVTSMCSIVASSNTWTASRVFDHVHLWRAWESVVTRFDGATQRAWLDILLPVDTRTHFDCLEIFAANMESYSPKDVVVSLSSDLVGESFGRPRKVRLPRNNKWLPLLTSAQLGAGGSPVVCRIRIGIVSNHSGGVNTKVCGLRVWQLPFVVEKSAPPLSAVEEALVACFHLTAFDFVQSSSSGGGDAARRALFVTSLILECVGASFGADGELPPCEMAPTPPAAATAAAADGGRGDAERGIWMLRLLTDLLAVSTHVRDAMATSANFSCLLRILKQGHTRSQLMIVRIMRQLLASKSPGSWRLAVGDGKDPERAAASTDVVGMIMDSIGQCMWMSNGVALGRGIAGEDGDDSDDDEKTADGEREHKTADSSRVPAHGAPHAAGGPWRAGAGNAMRTGDPVSAATPLSWRPPMFRSVADVRLWELMSLVGQHDAADATAEWAPAGGRGASPPPRSPSAQERRERRDRDDARKYSYKRSQHRAIASEFVVLARFLCRYSGEWAAAFKAAVISALNSPLQAGSMMASAGVSDASIALMQRAVAALCILGDRVDSVRPYFVAEWCRGGVEHSALPAGTRSSVSSGRKVVVVDSECELRSLCGSGDAHSPAKQRSARVVLVDDLWDTTDGDVLRADILHGLGETVARGGLCMVAASTHVCCTARRNGDGRG